MIMLISLLQNKDVSWLKEMLHDRVDVTTPLMLMCEGEILDNDTKLSEYSGFRNGAKLILQKQPVQVDLNDHNVHFIFHSPQVISINSVILYS